MGPIQAEPGPRGQFFDQKRRSIRLERWNCSIDTRSSKTLDHKRRELFLIRSFKDRRSCRQLKTVPNDSRLEQQAKSDPRSENRWRFIG